MSRQFGDGATLPHAPTVLPTTIEGDGPALLCLHGGPGLSDYLAILGEETDGWRRTRATSRGWSSRAAWPTRWSG